MTHAITPLEDTPDNSGSPKSPWLQLAEETKERGFDPASQRNKRTLQQ